MTDLIPTQPERPARSHWEPTATKPAPQGFDPWLLWVAFRQSWTWAVPAGAVLAGIAAFLIAESFVPVFEATHKLSLNQDHVGFRGALPSPQNLVQEERQIIYSELVLGPVLSRPGITDAPSLKNPETAATNLRSRLAVSNLGTKTLLAISYQDTDPEAAANVANAVTESYLEQKHQFDSARVSKLENWLNPEIQEWERNVAKQQNAYKSLSQKTHGFAPGEQVAALEVDTSLAASLRSEISQLKVQIALMTAHLRSDNEEQQKYEASLPALPTLPKVELTAAEPTVKQRAEVIESDVRVQEAKDRYQRTRGQIAAMENQGLERVSRGYYQELISRLEPQRAAIEAARVAAGPDADKLLAKLAQQDLEQRKSELAQRRVLAEQELKQSRQAEIQQRHQELLDRQEEIDDMHERIRVLEGEYLAEKSRLEEFGGDAAEVQFAFEEMQVAGGILEQLRQRRAEIRTERGREDLQTLEPAMVPRAPIEQLPKKKIIAASGVAFLLPFLLAVLWEFRVQRVTDAATMEKRSLTPVIGEVAKLPSGNRSGRGQRIFEESIDSLRANLFVSRESANARSLAVVSSMSGEGKSSVASQLAVSIAKATGETVLLVDADLRSPDQHDIFGLELGPGLTKVLSGEVELDEAIDRSLGDLVHVLPAGYLNESPHRLLNTKALRKLIDEGLKSYGHVVIDTAPILAAGESISIAAAVDVSLLCVLRDVSRIENVTRTTRRLEAAGATIGGTVFSGVPRRQYAYRYGDYRYALNSDA